ncbi:GNAT family N-acetyltransferase [Xylanimonas sp. McL0601]|uniref:GNAT family N-acetyltransferase n=1 Tax=Xylanimonas sp. McL0601 TaxID=3414739 RepID=UPI003CEC8CBC
MTAAPDDVVVRPAQASEAAEVAWLAATSFPLACPPGTPVEEMARHIAAHLAPADFRGWVRSPEHTLLVAVRDDQLVGYALLHLGVPTGVEAASVLARVTGSDGPAVQLSKLYAHPLARGSGSSSALMSGAVEAAAQLASANGYPDGLPLWLGTSAQNVRAQAFYRKHGFDVVGTRTYDVGGQLHDDVVMLHRP